MLDEYTPPHVPAPIDKSFRPRKSRYGRAPKDQRGNRDQRLRGKIKASVYRAAGLKCGSLERVAPAANSGARA